MEVRPIDANALVKRLAKREVDARRRYLDEQKQEALSAPLTFFEHGVYKCVKEYIQAVPLLSLNTLRDAIYQDAVAHGLWEENEKWPVTCATRIADEADELMDAGADWEDEGFDPDDPDEEYSEELADVVIMCMSVAGALGIDIDAAIRRKMEINKGRAWKHGKE